MSQYYLSPYINFQGRAREGMEFYHRVFGGSFDLQTMDAKGAIKPAGPGDRIVHASLEADGARTPRLTGVVRRVPATRVVRVGISRRASDRRPCQSFRPSRRR